MRRAKPVPLKLPAKLAIVTLVGAALWSCGDDTQPEPGPDAGAGGRGGSGGEQVASSNSGSGGAVA